jgi:glycine/D-amino acid oxidase-like deaminating enzyme
MPTERADQGQEPRVNDREFDLIVVGGGVFGLGTALEAGRRGRRTLVVDRRVVPNPVAASYGPSRKIRSTYLDEHYTRLALEAMAAWRQVEAETGRELYVAIGNLNVSDGDADAHLEVLDANARRGGAKVRWLEAADLRREFPQFRRGRRALLEEEAGFLRATDCVAALRQLAERRGVRFVTEQEAVVEPTSGGLAVRAGAATFRAPQVVVAAGGWSRRLLPDLGRALWQCQQGIMYLDGVPAAFCRPAFVPYAAADTGFYGFPAEAGQVGLKVARHHVTDPIDDPDFDRRTTPPGFVESARAFVRDWLGLDPDAYRITSESCMYNLSTSNDFLLDFHPGMPGVFVATAGSGHGFKFGSLVGRIVMDRLDGIADARWSPQFSYASFVTAGSRPRLL